MHKTGTMDTMMSVGSSNVVPALGGLVHDVPASAGFAAPAEPAPQGTDNAAPHVCGPNCQQHLFTVTRNAAAQGIDILA
jgi:hypothetical protein